MIRYFMSQFLISLKQIHDSGFVHRDLKPENLLMDHNYNLKIGDFGWAGPAQGRPENNNWLQTYCGTLLYMAPEILLNEPYDGKLVDIFAAGIIMFIMATG